MRRLEDIFPNDGAGAARPNLSIYLETPRKLANTARGVAPPWGSITTTRASLGVNASDFRLFIKITTYLL